MRLCGSQQSCNEYYLQICKYLFFNLLLGVYLDYYNGDMVDHITRYEARIYFVCQANVTIDGPIMEHFKESDQAHFHVFTKYAC